jgi:hypothetical protein
MIPIEQNVVTAFQERQTVIDATRAALAQALTPFIDLAQHSPQAVKGVEDLRRLSQTLKLRTKDLKPPGLPKAHVSQGRVPQFSWTYPFTSGTGIIETLQANVNTHTMINGNRASDGTGYADGRAGLGIFFYSPNAGTLAISAHPTIEYGWQDAAVFSSGSTTGDIGLYVSSFDLNNNFTGAPVHQHITLWDDSVFPFGDNYGPITTTIHPLLAEVQVDPAHFYNIWVLCHAGSASGDSSFLSTGFGIAELLVTVPSISVGILG